jgi:hypothetical protein
MSSQRKNGPRLGLWSTPLSVHRVPQDTPRSQTITTADSSAPHSGAVLADELVPRTNYGGSPLESTTPSCTRPRKSGHSLPAGPRSTECAFFLSVSHAAAQWSQRNLETVWGRRSRKAAGLWREMVVLVQGEDEWFVCLNKPQVQRTAAPSAALPQRTKAGGMLRDPSGMLRKGAMHVTVCHSRSGVMEPRPTYRGALAQ